MRILNNFLPMPFGALLISLSVNSLAQDKVDIGKLEYDTACAACHGLNGNGVDAALKSELVKPVPDLTQLAKNNDGVFPVDLVYQVIDGRKEIKAHGAREMPIWGRAFNEQATYYYVEQNPPYTFNSESIVRSRILALIDYLSRLQAK